MTQIPSFHCQMNSSEKCHQSDSDWALGRCFAHHHPTPFLVCWFGLAFLFWFLFFKKTYLLLSSVILKKEQNKKKIFYLVLLNSNLVNIIICSKCNNWRFLDKYSAVS